MDGRRGFSLQEGQELGWEQDLGSVLAGSLDEGVWHKAGPGRGSRALEGSDALVGDG